MITRDLMTLARERAMPVAYLLSGDEDLREAVVAAQDLGVQIVLLGITPVPGLTNQSFTLMNECDSNLILDKDFLSPHFSRPPQDRKLEPEPLLEPKTTIEAEKTESDVAVEVGQAYCDAWLGKTDEEAILLVFARLPVLPTDIDGPLLRHAEGVFGSLRTREDLRKMVRQAFVGHLERAIAARSAALTTKN